MTVLENIRYGLKQKNEAMIMSDVIHLFNSRSQLRMAIPSELIRKYLLLSIKFIIRVLRFYAFLAAE